MNLSDRGLEEIKKLAIKKKIYGEITISPIKNKRFRINYSPNAATHHIIDFGVWPPKVGTYFDYKLKQVDMSLDWKAIRKAWIARHKEIYIDNKIRAIDTKLSPDYYSYKLLW